MDDKVVDFNKARDDKLRSLLEKGEDGDTLPAVDKVLFWEDLMTFNSARIEIEVMAMNAWLDLPFHKRVDLSDGKGAANGSCKVLPFQFKNDN